MMQRADFEALARTVARWRLSLYSGTCDVIASDLADMCAKANPAFNRERFLAATRDTDAALLADAKPEYGA